jgi:hypothetical protein
MEGLIMSMSFTVVGCFVNQSPHRSNHCHRESRHLTDTTPRCVIGAILGIAVCATACGIGGDGPPYFIRGTASLPPCDEAPAETIAGSWIDEGVVEITGAGCLDAEPGERYTVCGLNWELSQQANTIEIMVDNEYRIDGRLCGDKLHLEGGWWLPVRDENGSCTYQEEDASEVVIQSGGNTLELTERQNGQQTYQTLEGTLSLGGTCTGRYTMALRPLSF